MTDWVTGAEILAHQGISAPTPDESDWADVCSAAINAGIDKRLTGLAVTDRDELAELVAAARGAGVETYKRREAPFGLTGYVDLQGAAIRIARDPLEAIAPIIGRYASLGFA